MNPFISDTFELVRLVEKIKPQPTFLLDRVFSGTRQIMSDVLPLEYRRSGEMAAPFVTKHSNGVNVAREQTQIRLYKAPLIAARRVIGIDDISQRLYGEQPVFSTMTPEERAARLQADDLKDLQRMVRLRWAAMAAQLLTTGKVTIKQLGDDGKVTAADTIEFSGFQSMQKDWTAASATIYEDLQAASMLIQKGSGFVPNLLICGENVLGYMRKNKDFKEYLLSANANATAWLDFKPRFTDLQTQFVGFLPPLSLEIYSYMQTYKEIDGTATPFIDPDTAILCRSESGEMVYGTVSYLNSTGQFQTAASSMVPVYTFSQNAQQTALTVYSRALPIPGDITDFVAIKCKA